jgi:hypothetical protein
MASLQKVQTLVPTAGRLVAFSSFSFVCLEFCVIIVENYTNTEMTDMVLCIAKSFRRIVFRIPKHFWGAIFGHSISNESFIN